MRDKRTLKFGYTLRDGKIHPHPDEAPVVEMIYIQYVSGVSYIQITSLLNNGSVFYHESRNPWNKNMVARIIGDETYLGRNGYPKLIDSDLFRRATDRKPNTGRVRDPTEKTIRNLCKCGCCGSKVALLSNQRSWKRWNCPTCGLLTKDATLPYITTCLEYLITAMQKQVGVVQPIPQKLLSQDKVQTLEKRLQEAMEQEVFDDSHARHLVMELAQARLEAIGSEDYETSRIRQLLTVSPEDGKTSMELLPEITSAILIPISGDVSLLLKNGQAIGRSDFEWQ